VTFSDDVAAEPQNAIDQLARMNGMASLLREHLHQSGRDIGMNQKYLQKVRIPQIARVALTA